MAIPYDYSPVGLMRKSGDPMPTSALLAYMPLNSMAARDKVGNEISYTNASAANFTTYQGIDCFDCTTDTRRALVSGFTVDYNRKYTISCWCAITTRTNWPRSVCFGYDADYQSLVGGSIYQNTWNVSIGGYNADIKTNYLMQQGLWYHMVTTFDSGALKLYVNGHLEYTSATGGSRINVGQALFSAGAPPNYTNYNYLRGYVAAARVYNRVLTDEEIVMLSNQFFYQYQITASDLSFSLYQKNQTYGISYNSVMKPVSFEIIEGSLPSTISFNTSTGQFTGKGLTDADHVYSLKVKITAEKSDPATVDVVINTYKTARISLSNQSFTFWSASNLQKFISYTSDQNVTMAIQSGTLPERVYFIADSKCFRGFAGSTAAETKQVVVRATSPNNQTGVAATMTVEMVMNQAILAPQTFKFYSGDGATTKAVLYSGTPVQVSDPAWSLTGTLPTGVTFSDGVFSSDASQVSDQSATVAVEISSQSGTSTPASAEMTVQALAGSNPIPSAIFYMPMTSMSDFEASDPTTTVGNYNNSYPVTFTTQNGIACAYMYNDQRRCIRIDNILNTWPLGTSPRTFSFWVKHTGNSSTERNYFWYEYADGVPTNRGKSFTFFNYKIVAGQPYAPQVVMYAASVDQIVSGSFVAAGIADTNWHHYAVTSYNNGSGQGQAECWLDGVMAYQARSDYPMDTGSFQNYACIGGYCQQSLWSRSINGYMAGFRVFDRVLTDAEIAALAAEYTPTA